MLFALGKIVVTRNALNEMQEHDIDPLTVLQRHMQLTT